VLAFAGFNSSTSRFKFVAQDMVGQMIFYNRTKLLNFTILQTNSAINLTHEAKNYLHCCYVKDMVACKIQRTHLKGMKPQGKGWTTTSS
jgi:hypothetical protein